MFMRYRGGGIGHKATWHLNDTLSQGIATETDVLDEIAQEEDEDEANIVTNAKQRQNEEQHYDSDETTSNTSDGNGTESDGYAEL